MLDREAELAVEAAALARAIHDEGSSCLVRRLNTVLARLVLTAGVRCGTGSAQVEGAVERKLALLRAGGEAGLRGARDA